MRIYWRTKPTVICLLLAAGMVRLAFWQADRHEQKQEFIRTMEARLTLPPTVLTEILTQPGDSAEQGASILHQSLIHRRAILIGHFDPQHEFVLRNRRYDGAPGVYVITPFRLEGRSDAILVSRGFIPLSRAAREARTEYSANATEQVRITALIKESVSRHFLAPRDPVAGLGRPWVDQWLRVNIPEIAPQIPYPVLPVWAEMMPTEDPSSAEQQIVRTDKGKEELLFLGFRETAIAKPDVRPDLDYPVPVFDPVIPPGRHLGYIYEWSFMAFATLLIGLIIQLRPPRIN